MFCCLEAGRVLQHFQTFQSNISVRFQSEMSVILKHCCLSQSQVQLHKWKTCIWVQFQTYGTDNLSWSASWLTGKGSGVMKSDPSLVRTSMLSSCTTHKLCITLPVNRNMQGVNIIKNRKGTWTYTLSLPRVITLKFLPAAWPEILHYTVWRTWLFIAYSEQMKDDYDIQILTTPHLYISL